jgi:hypothetical protein
LFASSDDWGSRQKMTALLLVILVLFTVVKGQATLGALETFTPGGVYVKLPTIPHA